MNLALRNVVCALALAGLSTSCIAKRRPLVLDSTPPGAVIYIDGESIGHSTPCKIDLANTPTALEFRLDGYETEIRKLRVGSRSKVVYWRDGIANAQTWPFPLWLGWEDFLFPIKEDDGLMPKRIHVRLKRRREPLASAREQAVPRIAQANAPR